MSIDGLIELFEDLVFRILSWILFLPKTYLLALQPGKASEYVDQRWQTPKTEQRYDETVSPVLFYALIVLLGAMPVDPSGGLTAGEYLERILDLPELQLISAFIFSFFLPIGTAILLLIGRRLYRQVSIKRESLRQQFDTQCLLWAVFASFGPLVGIILGVLPDAWIGLQDLVARFHHIPVIAYFTLLQTNVFEREFDLRPVYAFVLAGAVILGLRFLVVTFFGNPYAVLFGLSLPTN